MNQSRDERAAAAQARMMELATKFMERTAADIAIMRNRLVEREAGWEAAVAEIRNLAHRMVGTGATLGFESLADRAAHVESLAESCPPDRPPDDPLRSQLGTAIDALEAELKRLG
jgi:HPt (histidine-containing phosphotransfer) domain-containing protein